MDRVSATWTPTPNETCDSVLAWWKSAPPRLRVRERWIGRFVLVVGAVVLVVAWRDAGAIGVGIGSGLVFYGLLVGFDRTGVRLATRRLARLPNRDGPIHFVADLAGVRWEQSAEEHRYPWTSVAGVHVTDGYALLTFGDAGMIAIPRAALGDDGIEQLARLWTAANIIETLPPAVDP